MGVEERLTVHEQLSSLREQVLTLLFMRHVFRTHQEIVRLNPDLQGRARGLFSDWVQLVYNTSAPIVVRRIAGESPKSGDVSLIAVFDELLRDPRGLCGQSEPERSAFRRSISVNRKAVINASKKANHFANKRVAHHVPGEIVKTTFRDLDEAIESVRAMTEKYMRLVFGGHCDLETEMKGRMLVNGWTVIFTETWATPETVALPLGDTQPPRR